ncbi:MAG: hypothetical protein JSS14_13295 [Proteobacteria bacterium]|nr:hypothetical protein [Pseudomonadota bacterium]
MKKTKSAAALSLAALSICSTGFAQDLAASGGDVPAPLSLPGADSSFFRDASRQPWSHAPTKEPAALFAVEDNDVAVRALVFVGAMALQARTSGAVSIPPTTPIIRDPADPLQRQQNVLQPPFEAH